MNQNLIALIIREPTKRVIREGRKKTSDRIMKSKLFVQKEKKSARKNWTTTRNSHLENVNDAPSTKETGINKEDIVKIYLSKIMTWKVQKLT